MRYTKKNKRIIKATNAIDVASSTSKDFGYKPVAGKGGKTTNFEIPEWMFKREMEEMEGIINA